MSADSDCSIAQYYFIARSAHIERLNASDEPVWFFYTRKSYDFDNETGGANPKCIQISPWQLPRMLRRTKVKVVEINEPLMLAAWRVFPWVTISKFLSMGRLKFVCYALENLDPSAHLAQKIFNMNIVSRAIVRLVCLAYLLMCSRVCFGTEAARNLYAETLGPWWRYFQSRTMLIEHIPAAEISCGIQKRVGSFVFLGEFSERKGISLLMEAWDKVAARAPGVELSLLGKGPLVDTVRSWVDVRKDVVLIIDPSRELIASELNKSEFLILLSQSVAGWKEQVGLPLVEGWARGCNVITTDATGLSQTLSDHGHWVLPESATATEVAELLVTAAASPRPADDILRELPPVSGRAAASDWLHGKVQRVADLGGGSGSDVQATARSTS